MVGLVRLFALIRLFTLAVSSGYAEGMDAAVSVQSTGCMICETPRSSNDLGRFAVWQQGSSVSVSGAAWCRFLPWVCPHRPCLYTTHVFRDAWFSDKRWESLRTRGA